MLRLRTLLTRSLAPALACAVAVAACGGAKHAAQPAAATTLKPRPPSTKTLYIYSGLPQHGPEQIDALQIERGIRFALAWARARHQLDGYRVRYQALDDSALPTHRHRHGKSKPATSHGWNPAAAVSAAEVAAGNPQTVAYIGDLDSGATELSLPILNEAGIAQLTPGSGYSGLTDNTPGAPKPPNYYPQGTRSLFRLIPNDGIEAGALADWLRKGSPVTCHTVAAVTFGDNQFGDDQEYATLVSALSNAAKSDHLDFVAPSTPGTHRKTWGAYVSGLAQHQVNCLVVVGGGTAAAAAFTAAFHTVLPGAIIVGTSGLCNGRWTRRIPVKADPVLYCTTPVLRLKYYPGGTAFGNRYRTALHRAPTPYNYLGYLAANLVLEAIRQIGPADSRHEVLYNLVENSATAVLGDASYTFDPNGDISGKQENWYGLDRVVGGAARPYITLKGS